MFQSFLIEEMMLPENFFSNIANVGKSQPQNKSKGSATPIIKLKEQVLSKSFQIDIDYYTVRVSSGFFGRKEDKVYFEKWIIPLKIQWNTQWNHLFNGLPLVKVVDNNGKDSPIIDSESLSNRMQTLQPDITKLQEDLRKRIVKIIKSAHEEIPHLPDRLADNLSFINGKSFPFEIVARSESKEVKRSGWLGIF